MSLPRFIPVTGELELHNCPWRLTAQRGRRFYATEKLDGFSMSAGWINSAFYVSTRERLAGEDSQHAAYAAEFELSRRLRPFDGLLFQGELIGPGIRGNRLGLSIMKFRVFNVRNGDAFLDWPDVQAACAAAEFETVPLLGDFTLDGTVDQLLSFATMPSVFGRDKEGAVFRPVAESEDAAGRVSFKVFNPAY